MEFSTPAELNEIRAAVRELCAGFPGEYWRALEPDSYPDAFVGPPTFVSKESFNILLEATKAHVTVHS